MTIPPLPATGPVPFRLDGHTLELPPIPTRAWLDALVLHSPACWQQLLPRWLPLTQQHHLTRRLNDPADPLDLDDLEKHALTVLGTVLGIDFHPAQRLIVYARSNWMAFDAHCAEHGINPLDTHISRLVNITYSLRLQACEKESEQHRVRANVFAPPDGTRASGRSWDDDPDIAANMDRIESDAFMAAFSLTR